MHSVLRPCSWGCCGGTGVCQDPEFLASVTGPGSLRRMCFWVQNEDARGLPTFPSSLLLSRVLCDGLRRHVCATPWEFTCVCHQRCTCCVGACRGGWSGPQCAEASGRVDVVVLRGDAGWKTAQCPVPGKPCPARDGMSMRLPHHENVSGMR